MRELTGVVMEVEKVKEKNKKLDKKISKGELNYWEDTNREVTRTCSRNSCEGDSESSLVENRKTSTHECFEKENNYNKNNKLMH